ncbi:MAG TPA: BNR-4 repeat-containing protein [Prosthecobacter sp.]|nr:BNR-4 repeat-containing protein [Prosthecobacter sp.]
MNRILLLFLVSATLVFADELPTDDGFRGIWYSNQPTKDEYRFKYSGGMATYPQQHAPIAIYSAAANKTFFVYGGTTARTAADKQQLLHMISFFDHATGLVARPRILLNKKTDDAHDNPVLSIDDAGHLWVFSPSHGTSRPSFIHRSVRPYDITEFERVTETNFSYVQPWWLPKHGFLFLHTHYEKPGAGKGVRGLNTMTSRDGREWSAPRPFANIAQGDYQISWWAGGVRVATAFDHHPPPLGLNARSNIYYLETPDGGQTWTTAAQEKVNLPLHDAKNPALIYDSMSEGRLVYLKDLNFDKEGRPVILFLTSRGFEPGPKSGPHEWKTTRWTGSGWQVRPFTTSDNNYDHGSLYIEDDGTWRIIAPTETGPQAGNPGGEMVMWTSSNEGATWTKVKQLTHDSVCNHTYARRPLHAHPAFYALWADGHGREPSMSSLYFTDREGTQVWRLPTMMDADSAKPEIAW